MGLSREEEFLYFSIAAATSRSHAIAIAELVDRLRHLTNREYLQQLQATELIPYETSSVSSTYALRVPASGEKASSASTTSNAISTQQIVEGLIRRFLGVIPETSYWRQSSLSRLGIDTQGVRQLAELIEREPAFQGRVHLANPAPRPGQPRLLITRRTTFHDIDYPIRLRQPVLAIPFTTAIPKPVKIQDGERVSGNLGGNVLHVPCAASNIALGYVPALLVHKDIAFLGVYIQLCFCGFL